MSNAEGAPPDAGGGEVLFAENGWSWAWVSAAPLACLAAAGFEVLTNAPVHWLMLVVCAVASALCHAVMIAATRIHGRVRVTETEVVQGTEELAVSDIDGVYPAPEGPSRGIGGSSGPEATWENARTLGELRELPRRRTAVGLRLRSNAEVRVWARDAAGLRVALTSVAGIARPRSVDGDGLTSTPGIR